MFFPCHHSPLGCRGKVSSWRKTLVGSMGVWVQLVGQGQGFWEDEVVADGG